MEEQFEAEEKMRTRHMEEQVKIKEKLLKPLDPEEIQNKEPEAPITDNTEKAVANTYNLGIGRVRPVRESLITLEPEKVMSILTNPTYDKDDIDESNENMYFRFQQAIEREMAEQDFDPQQIIEEDTTEREQLSKEIAKEMKKHWWTLKCLQNLSSNSSDLYSKV